MKLEKLSEFKGTAGPVLTIVMDGVGLAPKREATPLRRHIRLRSIC